MGGGASLQYTPSSGDETAEAQLRALLPDGFQLSAKFLGTLKEYNHEVDALAMDDAVIISDAMISDPRNYDLLSERILTKTRGQLQRTKRMYSASSALAGGEKRELLSDLKTMFQGQYGDFITNLFRTKDEYNLYQLETAVTGLGCDEDRVIDILTSASPLEFQAIQKACLDENNETFGINVIEYKLIQGSVLQKTIVKLLNGKRNQEGIVADADTTLKLVADLMEFKKMIDIDGMLDLLLKASRSECEAINKKMYLSHFITLPAYIKSFVKNENAARAITMWTLPSRRAILHALHHGIYGTAYHSDDHSVAVCRIVSSLDKRDVREIKDEYHKVYAKYLFNELKMFLIGNIQTALDVFVNEPVFDNDFEKKIIQCVHDSAEGELAGKLQELLDEEIGHLKHYRSKSESIISQAKMRLLNQSEAPSKSRRFSSCEITEADLPPIAVLKRSPTKRSLAELANKAKAPELIETDIEEHIHPPNLLPYLVDLYDTHNPNADGEIPVEMFWKMIIDDVFRHAFTDYDVKQLKVAKLVV